MDLLIYVCLFLMRHDPEEEEVKVLPGVLVIVTTIVFGKRRPYALSGNTQQLLEAAHSLGILRKDTESYLKGDPRLHYIVHDGCNFPVRKQWWDLDWIVPGKPIWWRCNIVN